MTPPLSLSCIYGVPKHRSVDQSREMAEMTVPSLHKLPEIEQALEQVDPTPLIEAGFAAFSQGRVVIPPVGEMIFDAPPGDSHIKYGFVRGDDIFLVKIANYFPDNAQRGMPINAGCVLLFDQKTGDLRTILLDNGRLTEIRTAVAGAIAARYLAPRHVHRIGIVGAGGQARLQLQYLRAVTECREVAVLCRSPQAFESYAQDMAAFGFRVDRAGTSAELCADCNIIVTTTPSRTPILSASDIRAGTHITAMGSDSGEKQELASEILARADIVAVDSLDHAARLGELHHALELGLIERDNVVELGQIILDPKRGRSSDTQISVADLVGIAVQDIQIAKAVCTFFEK
jgi:ornithine cyclodeaminase